MQRRHLMALGVVLGAILAAAVFPACGGGDGGGGGGTTPVSVNSLDGATDVPVDSTFLYTFSQSVNGSSVGRTSYFIVRGGAAAAQTVKAALDPTICNWANALPSAITCSSPTACLLDPDENLMLGSQYTICLNSDISYLSGSPFEGFMATFTTTASQLGAPTGTSAIPGAGATELVISARAVEGATAYNLYWSTTAGFTINQGTKIEGIQPPYTHTGLTTGTTYYYLMTAVNGGGEGVASPQFSGIPQIDPVGTLDASFGGTGVVEYATQQTFARGVAVDAQGRIVTVGGAYDTAGTHTDDIGVWRYLPAGTPDASFDGDGFLRLHNVAGGNGNDSGYDVAIDGNGKIVLVGTSQDVIAKYRAVVVRLNDDGSMDSTFGTNGVVTFDRGFGDNAAYGIALDASGKIMVTGQSAGPTNDDMMLLRYTTAGALDTTFGTTGAVFSDNAAGGSGADEGNGVVVDADGTTIVAGSSVDLGAANRAVLWRYTTSGIPDTTFDGDGVAIYTAGSSSSAASVAVDGSGRIVSAGAVDTGASDDFAVWRYTPLGVLDATFNGDGVFSYSTANFDEAFHVAVDSRGRVVATGYENEVGGVTNMLLVRVTEAGELDTTFSGDGIVSYSVAGENDVGYDLTFDTMGSIVIAGQTQPPNLWYMTLWRYQ